MALLLFLMFAISFYLSLIGVSTEQLVLFRSKIHGGLSNEISILLDESNIEELLSGRLVGLKKIFFLFQKFLPQASKYLDKLKANEEAAIGLGDSAYNRSKLAKKIGLKTPNYLPQDGSQSEVDVFFVFF